MFRQVDHIFPYKKGYVAHGITDGGGKGTVNLADVRAVVIEPVNDTPCYCLICGMLDRVNMWQKRPVIYIHEFEDQSANRVFRQLMDDVQRLSITRIYANLQNEGFYVSLWRYRQEHETEVAIQPIVSGNNIEYGDALIREAIRDKAFITPKSYKPLVSQQTNQMKDIGYDPDYEPDYSTFYAWNALRHIFSCYVKHPPMVTRLPLTDISKAFEKDSRRPGSKYVPNLSQWAV